MEAGLLIAYDMQMDVQHIQTPSRLLDIVMWLPLTGEESAMVAQTSDTARKQPGIRYTLT